MKKAIALIFVVFTSKAFAVSAPSYVNASSIGNEVTILWSSADPLAWGHNIFRDEQYIGTSYDNSFIDTGVAAGNYQYYVSAFASGQYSSPSQRVLVSVGSSASVADSNVCLPNTSVISQGPGNSPSTPSNFRVAIYAPNSFELMWGRSTDDGYIVGYELKRDGAVLTQNDAASYYEGSVDGSRSYFYELAAIDDNGNRSATASITVNPSSQTISQGDTNNSVGTSTIDVNLPSNNREGSGRSVITLLGSNRNYFKDSNSRFIYIDSMPDQNYFVDRGEWTCSYYSASGGGFLIEPTFRSSTWIFYTGGAGSYNGAAINWSVNNTDISMANMFFDLVEVESDYQGSNSDFRYQNTIRFWETNGRYFECQASSNNS